LSEKYNVKSPDLYVGVVKGRSTSALGVYLPQKRAIYVKNSNVLFNPFVIIHEFYHHLRTHPTKHRGTEKHADRFAQEFIKAHLDNNVMTVAKHFPGQGSAFGDTHNSFVDVSKTWSSNELFPYKELINNNSLNAIMISHLFHSELDNKYPATLSKTIIQDLLRNKMGFEGIVISDDPQMKAISDKYNLETVLELMINAGIDIFCFGNNLIYDPNIVKKVHLIVMKLLDEDKISIDELQKSYFRVLNMKSIINIT